MPTAGNRTKAANGGPHSPPSVLASESRAAAPVDSLVRRFTASPMSVNSAPERQDTGNVSAIANHSTRHHSRICAPAVSDRKPE